MLEEVSLKSQERLARGIPDFENCETWGTRAQELRECHPERNMSARETGGHVESKDPYPHSDR